jgi:Arc/MetJ-type ribon-helix-helix transcriptional regulator
MVHHPILPVMVQRMLKTVFTARAGQVKRIAELVRAGEYPSASAFIRQAIDDKFTRMERSALAEQVERYCAAGHGHEDMDLIDEQAFPEDDE